jgi:hypothetical protein
MNFVPYFDLGGTPNIIVDSVPTAATILTLSHWPDSGTPAALQDDLSAQIVFHYLDGDPQLEAVPAVSNNHFDKDGLAGIFALLFPEIGQRYRDLVVDVASAGDFGVYRLHDAAHIAFAVSSYESSLRSPLAPLMNVEPSHRRVALLYQELLPRFAEWMRAPDSIRQLWIDEDAYLQETEVRIRRGDIRVAEQPDLDLAIVTIPDGRRVPTPPGLPEYADALCHPMAIHNATRMFRVLYCCGHRYEMHYRYETWVHYVSRLHPPRVDLAPLALELSALEGPGVEWTFDGVSEITPRLYLCNAEESRIPLESFKARLLSALSRG